MQRQSLRQRSASMMAHSQQAYLDGHLLLLSLERQPSTPEQQYTHHPVLQPTAQMKRAWLLPMPSPALLR